MARMHVMLVSIYKLICFSIDTVDYRRIIATASLTGQYALRVRCGAPPRRIPPLLHSRYTFE